MKIALGQINSTVGDFSGNAQKIIDYSRKALASGTGLIVFPEMSVCGYPARDWVEKPDFVAKSQETVERIASETQGIAVICGFPTHTNSETGKTVLNSAALLRDGKIEFVQSKMLLPTYDVFDEARNFAPATAPKSSSASTHASRLPRQGENRATHARQPGSFRRPVRCSGGTRASTCSMS